MTTSYKQIVWRNMTPAENWAWIKTISDALDEVGVVQTADTGQIDLSTGTVPITVAADPGVYQRHGYQIRKLEGPGKTTIYLRFEFGVRRASASYVTADYNIPTMVILPCKGTDGAGNANKGLGSAIYTQLGGNYSPSWQLPRGLYFASDGVNYLNMCIDPGLLGLGPLRDGALSSPLFVSMERTISPTTFTYDDDALVVVNNGLDMPTGVSSRWTFYWLQLGPNQDANFGTSLGVNAQVPGTWTDATRRLKTFTAFPVSVAAPFPKAPMSALLFYYWRDLSPAALFQTKLYGKTRTFLAAGRYTGNLSIQSPTLTAPAILFE